jgi:ubiquinone biosynthesis protein COQ4
MSAAPIHLDSIPLPLLKRAGQALFRTLKDSSRTDEIVVAEEILAQAQLKYWVTSGLFDSDEAGDLLADRADFRDELLDTLRGLSSGSLGFEFARFLDANALSLDALRQPTPYTSGDAESYLMSRLRQCHDLWHTLVGVGTEGHEEVLVHCFSIAQTGLPYSTVIGTSPLMTSGESSASHRSTNPTERICRPRSPLESASGRCESPQRP